MVASIDWMIVDSDSLLGGLSIMKGFFDIGPVFLFSASAKRGLVLKSQFGHFFQWGLFLSESIFSYLKLFNMLTTTIVIVIVNC